MLQESVSSARVVKSFVREQYEIDRFERENEANLNANLKNARYMATLTPTIEFVAALGVTLILWFGGNNVIAGETTAGSLVAFLAYAVNISNPIKRITRTTGNIQKALAAAQRVFDVMDLPEEVKDLPDAKALPAVTGSVRFEHVTRPAPVSRRLPVCCPGFMTVKQARSALTERISGMSHWTLCEIR